MPCCYLQGAAEEADAQLSNMLSELAVAKQQLAELSSQSASSLARVQMQAREEAALLRVKMEQVQGETVAACEKVLKVST